MTSAMSKQVFTCFEKQSFIHNNKQKHCIAIVRELETISDDDNGSIVCGGPMRGVEDPSESRLVEPNCVEDCTWLLSWNGEQRD